jgi:hypothetical protein
MIISYWQPIQLFSNRFRRIHNLGLDYRFIFHFCFTNYTIKGWWLIYTHTWIMHHVLHQCLLVWSKHYEILDNEFGYWYVMCLLQTAINSIFFILILVNAICCLEQIISLTSNSIILNGNPVINNLYFDFVLFSHFYYK